MSEENPQTNSEAIITVPAAESVISKCPVCDPGVAVGVLCPAHNQALEAVPAPEVEPAPSRGFDDAVPTAALPNAEEILSASDDKVPEMNAVAPFPARSQADPVLMSEEEAKAITVVNIAGNGPGYRISVPGADPNAPEPIIPLAAGLQMAFFDQGTAAVFGVPTSFIDGPEVPPERRRLKVTPVRCAVHKMCIVSRPSCLRLKNTNDAWWTWTASMLKQMPNSDALAYAPEFVMAIKGASDGTANPITETEADAASADIHQDEPAVAT